MTSSDILFLIFTFGPPILGGIVFDAIAWYKRLRNVETQG